MATTIAFGFLMALLFGGMMLALVMGYTESEKARRKEAQQDHSAVVRSVQEAPHFFAQPQPRPAAARAANGTLDHLEGYLRAEQALVAQFVNDPTLDNLYRQAHVSQSVN